MRVISIIGTRPQYIKLKPLYDRLKQNARISHKVYDTRQHYSSQMSDIFQQQFGLETHFLNTDVSTPTTLLTSTIQCVEKVILKEEPDIIMVYGDTNSTLGAALAANKGNIPVFHIEAGVRSFDKTMPEEINRLLVDEMAAVHLCPTPSSTQRVQGVYCGDLEYELLNTYNLENVSVGNHYIMTCHRQSNMTAARLKQIFSFVESLNEQVFFSSHHTPLQALTKHHIELPPNVEIIEAVNHYEMIKRLKGCKGILTDSGGIQKITPWLGKRAIILRDSSEWGETFEKYNKLVSFDSSDIDFLSHPADADKGFYINGESLPSEIVEQTLESFS